MGYSWTGDVDNVAAKQKTAFFFSKVHDMMVVHRLVGAGREYDQGIAFFCVKKIKCLQQWLFVERMVRPDSAFAPFGNVQVRSGPGGGFLDGRSKRDRETPAEATSHPLNYLPLHPPSSKIGDEEEKVC